ncbi:MAG: glycoside hydrolase family 16 protein [Planctomycetes bacterium]|nr:glycoside hydrolase family 16 protein [Planctomycetota bacterium]
MTKSHAQKNEWKLIWSDEFDYTGEPDDSKWTREEGFLRNAELQLYTPAGADNVRVENGMLVIEAIKERIRNPAYDPAETKDWRTSREYAEYTSGSVRSKGKAEWQYGRIEVRAKLPAGRGMWPAIWMLAADVNETGWPECGEIDIMEYVGFEPDTIYATVHTKDYNHVLSTQKGAKIHIADPDKDFHVYAVEWDARKMDFFVDDENYFTFENEGTGTDTWPYDKKYFLTLNIAIGGAWGGQKGIDESIFPRKFCIDYVRVYQK